HSSHPAALWIYVVDRSHQRRQATSDATVVGARQWWHAADGDARSEQCDRHHRHALQSGERARTDVLVAGSNLAGDVAAELNGGGVVAIQLNHLIVPSNDPLVSATFLAELLGKPAPVRFGPFWTVSVDN